MIIHPRTRHILRTSFDRIYFINQPGVRLFQAGSNDFCIKILTVKGLNLHALLHHTQVVDLVKVVNLIGGGGNENEVRSYRKCDLIVA